MTTVTIKDAIFRNYWRKVFDIPGPGQTVSLLKSDGTSSHTGPGYILPHADTQYQT